MCVCDCVHMFTECMEQCSTNRQTNSEQRSGAMNQVSVARVYSYSNCVTRGLINWMMFSYLEHGLPSHASFIQEELQD